MSKIRVSVLLCANADASHRLRPMVVGNAKKPRALRPMMDTLPVHYASNKMAWLTTQIIKDWFSNEFVPAVKGSQRPEAPQQDEEAENTHPAKVFF